MRQRIALGKAKAMHHPRRQGQQERRGQLARRAINRHLHSTSGDQKDLVQMGMTMRRDLPIQLCRPRADGFYVQNIGKIPAFAVKAPDRNRGGLQCGGRGAHVRKVPEVARPVHSPKRGAPLHLGQENQRHYAAKEGQE